jgi:hypothetical protein
MRMTVQSNFAGKTKLAGSMLMAVGLIVAAMLPCFAP